MRIGENGPFGRQLIHVRRPGLGIPLQHAIPVIQIIDGDKQDIWFSVPATGLFSLTAPAHYAKQ